MLNSKGLVYAQPGAVVRDQEAQNRFSREFKFILLLSLAHLPLGVILYNAGIFALLHPLGVFSVGLAWAVKKRVRLDYVGLAIAYLIGAEVLWRMAKVPVPWEFGKYGSAAIMIIALIKRRQLQIPTLPLVYFAALMPACLLTFVELSIGDARAQISSNLSGPLLLAVSCWFFAHVKTSPLRLRRFFFAILIPLISVACATLFYTVTAEEIYFTTESNFSTSGGFGPNQVSAMLGLGLFAALSCLLIFRVDAKYKVLLGIAAVFFAAQSVMTFSRGGVYNAMGAISALLFFQFRRFTEGMKRLIPVLALAGIFLWLVFPALDDFTDGKLQERFDDTGTSNRVEIAQSDFEIFFENPIWGVGVGLANEYRKQHYGYGAGSHTEFSRLISEHGMFGLAALASLLATAFFGFKKQTSSFGRALIAGVCTWCVLFMINAGMRLAAPSLLWGLLFITFIIPRRRPLRSGSHQNE